MFKTILREGIFTLPREITPRSKILTILKESIHNTISPLIKKERLVICYHVFGKS